MKKTCNKRGESIGFEKKPTEILLLRKSNEQTSNDPHFISSMFPWTMGSLKE